MSAAAISALERGSRRAPYRSSVDLLADGLGVAIKERDRLHALAQHWRKLRALPRRGDSVLESSSTGPLRTNLPIAISSFIGRESELDDVIVLTERCRLLTIVGAGGIGKTRLALQLAAKVLDRYADGVWFVDLTNVRDPDAVVQAVAEAIGLRELPNEPLDKTLLGFLSEKKTLLILDSSEHLLAGVTKVVKAMLSRSAMVSLVATSREPLHIIGEQAYRLGPMSDSVRLFVERAREADPGFTFGDAEKIDVEALCERLDGMPLAIELACARLSSMTVRQLAARLPSALALASKDATETSRHRTLRETIAWSYHLLSATEQRALMALAVFSGGSTRQAIRSVALDVPDVDDAVESLVDKSLLQTGAADASERFQLLDVVREYAREQLAASGEYEAAARRHALHYGEVASAPETADIPNLRVAIDWSMQHDVALAGRIVLDLAPYWRVHGAITEARLWIARVLEITQRGEARAALLCRAASFATFQDDLAESLRFSQEALDLYRELGDGAGEAEARFRIAEAEHRRGHLEPAEGLYQEARVGYAASGNAVGEMRCIGNLGMIARQRKEYAHAFTLMDEAIRRAYHLGENRVASEFTMALAWAQLGTGDTAEAQRLFGRALDDRTLAEDPNGVCQARHGLATIALVEGRRDDAYAEFAATLTMAQQLQLKHYVARALHGMAALLASTDVESAARFLGLADRLFSESGRVLRDSVAYDIAAQAIEAVAEPRRSALVREGTGMHVADAVALLESMGRMGHCPPKQPSA